MSELLVREFRDEVTGEVVRQWYQQVEEKKKTKPRDKNFMRCRPQALQAFLERDDVSPAEQTILLWMASGCNWENYCDVDRAEMMARLKLSRTAVYNALKGLEKKGLIIFNDKKNKLWIEPSLCWKGYTEKLPAASKLFRQRLEGTEAV